MLLTDVIGCNAIRGDRGRHLHGRNESHVEGSRNKMSMKLNVISD